MKNKQLKEVVGEISIKERNEKYKKSMRPIKIKSGKMKGIMKKGY